MRLMRVVAGQPVTTHRPSSPGSKVLAFGLPTTQVCGPPSMYRSLLASLLVAATAEKLGLAVLTVDKDFDLIAQITGQPVETLASS